MTAVPDDISLVTVFPGLVTVDRQHARELLANKEIVRRTRHLKPLLEATRDFACWLLIVFQGRHEHAIPTHTPWITILGDDTVAACGPGAFHGPSLDALIFAADQAILITSGPEQTAYNAAATFAARDRRNVVLIETLPVRHLAWEDRLRLIKGDNLSMLTCLPFPEGTPEDEVWEEMPA